MVNFLCFKFIIIAPPCGDDNGQQNRAILVPSKAAQSSSSAKLKGETRKKTFMFAIKLSLLIFSSKNKSFCWSKTIWYFGEKTIHMENVFDFVLLLYIKIYLVEKNNVDSL